MDRVDKWAGGQHHVIIHNTIKFKTIDGIDIGFEQVEEIHLYLIQTFSNHCFIEM